MRVSDEVAITSAVTPTYDVMVVSLSQDDLSDAGDVIAAGSSLAAVKRPQHDVTRSTTSSSSVTKPSLGDVAKSGGVTPTGKRTRGASGDGGGDDELFSRTDLDDLLSLQRRRRGDDDDDRAGRLFSDARQKLLSRDTRAHLLGVDLREQLLLQYQAETRVAAEKEQDSTDSRATTATVEQPAKVAVKRRDLVTNTESVVYVNKDGSKQTSGSAVVAPPAPVSRTESRWLTHWQRSPVRR